MNKSLRLKILSKLAQTAPPSNLPTTSTSQIQTISGSPPSFVPTNWYPTLQLGFGARNASIINNLSNLLNNALYYSSAGKVHLNWMRTVNFNFGTDQVPDVNLKYLMGFCKQIYTQLFNNGLAFERPLAPVQIKDKIDGLKSSQLLNNLSQTNMGSQLGAKIGGNLKTLIIDWLLQIK